jgi:hypothetical protein
LFYAGSSGGHSTARPRDAFGGSRRAFPRLIGIRSGAAWRSKNRFGQDELRRLVCR